ncbi:hypothetical protein [Peptococcus niger]|uniref:Uncharacterized protein n=1 Tax=Peptococcus niger TaxID=2741 RepID=A0A1G6Z1U7_PEPNI|nr:hypothetical protein [Peptococcus niger]SDD96629.1 hypothetical protein SAMN04489866_11155 [Peptococcus niger]
MNNLTDLTGGNWLVLATALALVLAFIVFRRGIFLLAEWFLRRHGG